MRPENDPRFEEKGKTAIEILFGHHEGDLLDRLSGKKQDDPLARKEFQESGLIKSLEQYTKMDDSESEKEECPF